jgi:hypothetical protein
MKKSIRASKVRGVKRKKPGPAPTGKGELIAIRWRDDDLAIIDGYAKAHDLSRGEALREIVRQSRKR